MKKLIIFGIVIVIAVLACVFCLVGRKSNKIDTTTPIFKTENIKSITLYRLPDQTEGIVVPDEYMQEITDWLGTFTVSKKSEDVLCGQNTFTFRIEYSDGNVVTSGADTTTIDGVIYYTNRGAQPDCINKLFKDNSSQE